MLFQPSLNNHLRHLWVYTDIFCSVIHLEISSVPYTAKLALPRLVTYTPQHLRRRRCNAGVSCVYDIDFQARHYPVHGMVIREV